MKGYRDVQTIRDDRVFDLFPRGSVTPVAVELLPTAESLLTFEHPEDALYVLTHHEMPENHGFSRYKCT
jgi:hypothetical protein